MTDQQENLHPLVRGDQIKTELRRRKQKYVYQTIKGLTREHIAETVKYKIAHGWQTVKNNIKSTRMKKLKPVDEQLEDEVWCILAQMGFTEMSKGRNFTIKFDDGLPPHQIDIFAKDDETVVIIECMCPKTASNKSMMSVIEKVRSVRKGLQEVILGAYNQQPQLKIKSVIVTRNVTWSNVDLTKCRTAQIGVLTEGELHYYVELVRHIKEAARYQFLAHMFERQKINGLVKQVVAAQGKMGEDTFYTFLIHPDELLKIAYVGHKASRDIENLATYQRMLQPNRLKKIAKYINDDGRFPTNIVINLKTPNGSDLQFDRMEVDSDEVWGTLHLPPNYASAWIIDGQHRLYGYVYARDTVGFNPDNTTLPVLAYENLSAEKEMNLFIDINSKQVKVRSSLLVELYADLHWCSSNADEAFQALHSRIASRLNSTKTSPLHERMVVTGKRKTRHRCLTTTSIRAGLDVAKLLGTFSRGTVLPGPLSTAEPNNYEANLDKALSVLSDCLGMFSTELKDHWNLGDGAGGYLCTNNGIRALFHVIKDITENISKEEDKDLCQVNANKTSAAIRPYLKCLIDYFKSASNQEIKAFRQIGSSLTAVRQQAYGMDEKIHQSIDRFNPPGLEDYMASRDQAGTEEATNKVTKLHRMLSDYVIRTLKDHYGTEGKVWWVKGIPVTIRTKCTTMWEEKGRKGKEEENLNLIHYVRICMNNWELVKDVISLGSRNNNKKAGTQWIKNLNDIRQITAHPERGRLNAEQVDFLDRYIDKAERYFPMETQN